MYGKDLYEANNHLKIVYKVNKLVAVIYAVFIIGIYGCKFNNEEELYALVNCNNEEVTFTNTVSPIIINNCATTGCHVAGTERVLLTNYTEIKAAINGVENRTITDKNMPPSGPLSACDISKLKKWIDDGALNN